MHPIDEFYNSRIVKKDYTQIIEYINEKIFTYEGKDIQGYLFFAGNRFCEPLPDYIPNTQAFWDAFTEFYYDGIEYYLETHSINNEDERFDLIVNWTNRLVDNFGISDEVGENIWIEYMRKQDENLTANKKNGTKSTKSKKTNLKSI